MDVRSEDFLSANIAPDVNLLIIRSQSIDAAGENLTSVGYAEMESEMRLFTKCIRACKNLGFDQVVILADHGYMIQPKYQAGDNMSKPVGTSVMNERRSQAGDLNGNENSWLFTSEHIGVRSQSIVLHLPSNMASMKRIRSISMKVCRCRKTSFPS